MPAYFNLPISLHFTKKVPSDERLKVQSTSSLVTMGNSFAGLGPIWVIDEGWYYYFDENETPTRWPTSGSISGSGTTDEYLFTTLTVDYYGQVSMSIDSSYDSYFLMIENLVYKRNVDFNQVTNGINKYVTWDNANGILEEEDNVILVYKNL